MITHMAGMTFWKMPSQCTKDHPGLNHYKPHPQLSKSLSMSKKLDVKTMSKPLLPLWIFNQINLFFFSFFYIKENIGTLLNSLKSHQQNIIVRKFIL